MRRIGCLGLIAIIALGAYVTRHHWLPRIAPWTRVAERPLVWAPLSPAGADRARRSIARLDRDDGPVFANVLAADFASFLLDSAVRSVSDSVHRAEATMHGQQLLFRTRVRVGDLGAENVPLLGGVADKTATIVVGGTFVIDRPGLGELRVKQFTVDDVEVPEAIVPRMTRALARRIQRAGTYDDALGFALPPRIADFRVRGDTITLYRTVMK